MKHTLPLFIMLIASLSMHAQSIDITWQLVANDVQPGICESQITIANHSGQTLTADGEWLIGYCWMSVHPYSFPGAQLQETEVCASYHTLRPTDDFIPLHDGEERTFRLLQKGAIIRESAGPQGAFFVANPAAQPVDAHITSIPFNAPAQWTRKNNPGYADGNWVFNYNNDIQPISTNNDYNDKAAQAIQLMTRPLNIMPEPKQVISSSTKTNLYATINEAREEKLPKEGYRLTFYKHEILLEYADENGRFYAHQTLNRLRENKQKIFVRQITDYPDLHHRGIMLDIARNYIPKTEIYKILDVMAAYKLNIFHFHIVDDEAWRVEIPGLPELTEVGGQRGYTTSENDCLYPAYNGGWNKNAYSSANGFLTRQDYIDIVRYAQDRCIQVIPEIDMPGHSRAAIRAMEERYRRYIHTDPEAANQFRLIDPDDKSVYSSAQYYTDDVICIARQSCYNFAYKIIDEIALMHNEAGQPLTIFHVGGDEVAKGAFEGSPICQEKMKELGMSHTYELKDWFLQQLINKLQPMGVQIAGWEEIAMRGGEANPVFADKNVLSWCWNSIPEWKGDEKPYRLANAGYPVILACVGNLYIDMSYTNHQQEKALHWGGYTDERSTFDFLPFDIYRSVRYNMKREKRDIDEYDQQKTLRLKTEAKKNIIGLQGQLFSETIRNAEQVQQYIFPKLQGIAERGWNAYPASQQRTLAAQYNSEKKAFETERTVFLYQLYNTELPRIHNMGIRFHLAQPGIRIQKQQEQIIVTMNHPAQKAVIRYTTDGSEPNNNSPIYKKPFTINHYNLYDIRAKAFYLGEESATTISAEIQ